VQDVAKRLGLEDLLHRFPKALSGGQRQRVAVGRAIVRQPRAFLFDEPLSNLDASLRTQLRMELKRLHQELKTTMIYVTHDQVEAMTLADRIAVLKDGTLQQLGTPTELFQKPANRFVAGFIGAPNMNFLDGEIGQDGGAVRGAGFSLQLPAIAPALHGAKVCVGFRPSAVHVLAGEGDGGDLQGEMEVAEVLGWAAHLHLRVASGKIVAQIPAQELGDLAPGSRVELSVAPEDIHLFHAETGASLRVEELG
jgi:ABC-type sugar transport system ATPase subunit